MCLALFSTVRGDIIFDNFDEGGGFHPQSNSGAASASINPPFTFASRAAVQFTVTGRDFTLNSITLPISVDKAQAEPDVFQVRLTEDNGGVPGTTVEVLSSNGSQWPALANPFTTATTLTSSGHPVLLQGRSYWIVTELTALPAQSVDCRWFVNTSGNEVPFRQQQAQDALPADPWGGSQVANDVAFRVEGDPLPQIPQLINYQGRIAIGTPAVNFEGYGQFKFALVDGGSSATLWSNDGTSSAGSEPDAAVTLQVTKGLYSVLLGNAALPHMTAIPYSVFARPDVRLRVWFDDGTRGFQLLTPDQRVAAVGYAMMAANVPDGTITGTKLAAGAVGSASIAAGAVGSSQLAANAVQSSNIAANAVQAGNIASGAIGSTQIDPSIGLWTASGENVSRGTGYVGIGTTSPADKLHVSGAIRADQFRGPLVVNGGNLTYAADGGDHIFTTGTLERMRVTVGGNIGIGTPSPTTKLDVAGAVKAASFTGDGSGLSGVTAASVAIPPGMVLVPAGAFTMGNSVAADTDITNAVPVSVTLSAFYLSINEVTLSQWQAVYYWATSHGYSLSAGAGKSVNHPVQTVNWYDCVKWCNARSEMEGLTPCYTVSGAAYMTDENNNVVCNWNANGYRLPSEAEWEKAARGGLSGQRFPWGDTINQNLANYYGNTSYSYDLGPTGYNVIGNVGASPYTTPVGTFAANGYGINDMGGNVWEWCWDWYGTPYAGGSNPHGPASGLYRVFRGGSWVTRLRRPCRSPRQLPPVQQRQQHRIPPGSQFSPLKPASSGAI